MDQTLWVQLGVGVQVIRMWEIPDGPKKPEIAILRMSEAVYEKFHEDPQAFLEEHKVFPFKLRRVDQIHSAQKRTGGTFIAAIYHRNDCSAMCMSEPEPS